MDFERSKSIKNLQVDLRELVLPVNVFEMEEISNVKFKIIETIQNISKDKKKNHTGNRFVLLKQIGNPKIVSNINPNIVKESILRLIK